MWLFLADENFHGDIVRGLTLRHSGDLNILRIQDAGIAGKDDESILEWAAKHDRIVLTHDRATMPDVAYTRIKANEPMPGLFVLNDRFPVNRAIQEIALMVAVYEQIEFASKVVYLPL